MTSYSKNGTTIKVSSIKDSDYKFEKIPSRIAKLIQDSEKVRTSQRDYKNYTTYNFKKKLEFYAEKFDESERLLHTIVQFDSCLFGDDDIKMLIKFLQEADKVWDGEKTIKELEEFITDNSIKPTHTERINAIEEKKMVDAIKTENKKIATLRNLQENFDAHLNILYENNLNYLAEIYSKYKPSSLDEQQIKIAKTTRRFFAIMDTTTEYTWIAPAIKLLILNQKPDLRGLIFLISKAHNAGDKVKAFKSENIIAVAIVTENC